MIILTLKYLGAYLMGILFCVLLTPVEFMLLGSPVYLYYPLAAVGFILYYTYLTPAYTFGTSDIYWNVATIGLLPLLSELILLTLKRPQLRRWRPLWIGLPIGFIGTLGVYYTLAASV